MAAKKEAVKEEEEMEVESPLKNVGEKTSKKKAAGAADREILSNYFHVV